MRPTSQEELDEIVRLRQTGRLTAKEAYERHVAALGAWTASPATEESPVVAAAPTIDSGAAVARAILLQPIVLLMALLGGALGIVGALLQELFAGGGYLGPFIAAPIIEEALKPAGIYILLILWPQALFGRFHTATLTAMSGLCFGLIESYVYVTLYYPEGDASYVLYRFTVPVMMHTVASCLVGFGLSRTIVDWANGRSPFPKVTRNFYIAGVLLHAIFNVTVVVLDLAGVLEF
jgi:RsiW-degrading membrane proteinase PrsW (M82 family)